MIKYLVLFIVLLFFSCSTGQSADSNGVLPNGLGTDRLVFNSNRTGNHEIYTIFIDGADTRRLTNDPSYESWWPKISPDRTKVLFYRAPRGEHENFSQTSLWVYEFSSDTIRMLRDVGDDGWSMQGHGEWSPDGTKIAMFGSSGSSLEIFVTDSEGRNAVQYTDRGGINTDVSWSPDGATLIFNGFPGDDHATENYELYVMAAEPLATPVRLTNDTYADYDPYFSPDGEKIAWLRLYDPSAGDLGNGVFLGDWAICVSTLDEPGIEYLIQDGNINSKPSWSHDVRKYISIVCPTKTWILTLPCFPLCWIRENRSG